MLNRPRCGTIFATIAGLTLTPGAIGAQDRQAVNADRLMSDLSVMAHDSMAGRGTGTAGARRARSFIVSALQEAGLASPDRSPLRSFTSATRDGINVVASVEGLDPENDVVVLTAHYDHLGTVDGQIYNGADDNASGVAALLEIGRQLRAAPLRHPVLLVFFDAEEGGLVGSHAFVSDPSIPVERMALNVNLDMVSRTNGLLWAGGAYHTPSLRPILEEVAKNAPLDLRLGHDRPGAPEGDDWTESSDHAAFHAVGIPWVYFGVEDHVDYHEPTDDFERVDPEEFTEAVETILLALRALDDALLLEKATTR